MYLKDGSGLPLAGPVLANGPYDFHDLLDIGELAAGETTTTYVVFVGPVGQTLDRLAFRNWIEGDSEELSVDLGGAVIEVTEPEPIAIGETFEVNGLRVTVHDVKYPTSYSYKSGIMSGTYSPETGGVYAQVDLTIENVSNPEPHDFSETNVLGTLGLSTGPGASARILADDVIYTPDDLLGLYKEEAYPKPQWWKVKPLAIGDSERAFVVFIVPDNAAELLFEYREPTLGPTPQVKLK